ncbi:MAG TPA: tRNA lysidine(34) synthetase TilS [Noviherbaspirillum sp.]|nr:tRNA lysidine(34) synthetase TilS [Noviherbaspirillum sp.]
MKNRPVASLVDAFERALGAIRTRVSVSGFAVAYSGGLDSAALLHLAKGYATQHGLTLFAFHIHHGISQNADLWLLHCEHECESLGIRFAARRVDLSRRDKDGLEQVARIKRYQALGELCRAHQVPLLITAHHQDDQAETVLLQMLRGSGVAGLSGMEKVNTAPGLLGDPDLFIGRPLLDISRDELERFVVEKDIRHVEDESNADFRYARNALRHKVMPSLAEYFPGFQDRFARVAQHAQAAQRLLDELAAQDLSACLDDERIDIDRLRQLGADRIDNLLRYWFASRGVRMPTTAWLSEMREQLLGAREDAQLRVTHADCEIRRYRGRIFLTARENEASSAASMTFRWHGESRIHLPEFGGSLYFDAAEQGMNPDWLRGQELRIRYRTGGEKLKAALNRPTRSLKHHYQALSIPPWERKLLPVIMAGGHLIFAAGIGMNWHDLPLVNEGAILMRWKPDVK